MPQELVAITNFWELHDTNSKLADAIYNRMIGDAYPRAEIDRTVANQLDPEDLADMSEATYLPVLTEAATQKIERHFGVKLPRRHVRPRPDVSNVLYELA